MAVGASDKIDNKTHAGVVYIGNPPIVTLEQRVDDGLWSDEDVIVDGDGPVLDLRWSSTNADSCSSTGFGFVIDEDETSGERLDVTTPSVFRSEMFTIICNGPGGTAKDGLLVTNYPSNPDDYPPEKGGSGT